MSNLLHFATVDFTKFRKGQICDNSFFVGFDSSNNNALTKIDSNLNKHVLESYTKSLTISRGDTTSLMILTSIPSKMVYLRYYIERGEGIATGEIEVVKTDTSTVVVNELVRTLFGTEEDVDYDAISFSALYNSGKIKLSITLSDDTKSCSFEIIDIKNLSL